jgi:hypothetical protein
VSWTRGSMRRRATLARISSAIFVHLNGFG